MKEIIKKIPKPLFKPEECLLPIDTPPFKKPSQLVIIGGGVSIKEGISKGIWDKLKEQFTMGINYSFHYFKSTIQTYIDKDFYKEEVDNLKNLSLIIGKYHKDLEEIKHLNTIMLLENNSIYIRDLSKGCYKTSICGLFSLSLGIYLLDKGEIFLLGYDWGDNGEKDKNGKPITHFYQGKIKHRGIGKVNHYNSRSRVERDFKVYSEEKKVKIYNVSLESKINTFPKISYDTFFEKLDNNVYDQNKLRQIIQQKLEDKNVK